MKRMFLLLGLCVVFILIPACALFKKDETTNPIITHFEWGKVVVNFAGTHYTFKDCKLSPNAVQEWDWKEFNTKHVPGIQIEDLQSIIKDSEIIILSRGVDCILQTPPETIEYLKG